MKPIRPHPDHHDLHGITIAVDTRGGPLFVGRCHDMDERVIRLVDVAEFTPGENGVGKRAWLTRVAKFGPFPQHDRLVVEQKDVVWFDTLGNIADHGPPAECAE